MERKIWLDLDRTIFRTTLGVQAIWGELAQAYPEVISAQSEIARQSEFYEYDETAYVYNFSEHVQALGIDVEGAYEWLRTSEIADGRLEYDGAKELVDYSRSIGDVAVLTYGEDQFQRLKASLCPSVEGIPVATVRRPKADFLQAESNSWLIDDKPVGDALSEGVRLIQVLQEGQPTREEVWPIATSLNGVVKILEREVVNERRV